MLVYPEFRCLYLVDSTLYIHIDIFRILMSNFIIKYELQPCRKIAPSKFESAKKGSGTF